VILILLFRPGGLMPRQVRGLSSRLEVMSTLLSCDSLSMPLRRPRRAETN